MNPVPTLNAIHPDYYRLYSQCYGLYCQAKRRRLIHASYCVYVHLHIIVRLYSAGCIQLRVLGIA